MSAAELNEGQAAAVTSSARRIVVSAGAGSGKTRVLAERFADAVLAGESAAAAVPMRAVLLITFTEKAAGELIERVRRVFLERDRSDLAREVDGAWISTIHGFCARIARRHALELGIDPGFGVLADPQVGIVRHEAFETATRELLAQPRFARLIELHGPESLRKTTCAAYDRVRSMGADVSHVRVGAPPDLAEALRGLTPALRGAIADYGTLATTKTIDSNIAKYLAAIGVAERASASALDRRAILEVAGLHPTYRGDLRGSEEAKGITAAANEALMRAAQAAVDTLAAEDAGSWLGLLAAYGRSYESAKSTLGVMDFEDLQLVTRRLWRERPEAARRYARQFEQVMIDEFQDTNELQFQAIEPVAGRGLCVVGDVQQSIYRFRDADVGLFIAQRHSAEADPGADSCRLTVNYRSHPELLSALNALFRRPGLFGADYLHLEDAGERPSAIRWPAGEPRAELILVDKAGWEANAWREAEARALALRLRALVDDGRMAPDDIVVLARAMTTARPFVAALRAVGFEVFAADAGGFYAAPEVADARALLRVLANPLDGEGVLGLLAGGLGGVSDDALCLLAASRADRSLWAALPMAAELGLSERDFERTRLVRETVDLLRDRLGRMRLVDALLYAFSTLGPGGGCLAREGARANLRKVARLAAEFEQVTPSDPAAFRAYLDDRETYVRRESASGTASEGAGAIRVMSVHGAKGLEFPVVALIDLGHGAVRRTDDFIVVRDAGSLEAAADVSRAVGKSAPRASAINRAEDLERQADAEEAKRVFYVACTRAEQVLLLTGSARLDKPPGEATDLDLLRSAIEDTDSGDLPGLRITCVTAADEPADAPVARPTSAEATAAGAATPPSSTVLRSPMPISAPNRTSFTALSLYERCAYRFFAERMLGVGSLDVPAGDDPRALGSALHGALQTLAEGRDVDDSRLRSLAAAHGLAQEGIGRLKAAVDSFVGSPVGGLLASGRAEVPLSVRVGDNIVTGSMDLVVRDGDTATVVDYKTGMAAEVDTDRYAAQAEIYALALLEAGCSQVTVRFIKVEAGCAETAFAFTESDRARIAARVDGAFAAMSRGEFERRRSFDPSACAECPVSGGLCAVVHPGAGPRSART